MDASKRDVIIMNGKEFALPVTDKEMISFLAAGIIRLQEKMGESEMAEVTELALAHWIKAQSSKH